MATRPTVASIIAGATKPEQIDANVTAISWEMTPEQISMVDDISQK
jgi:aryl-alcohol dehydrogenase-like predicted oxidoreductase